MLFSSSTVTTKLIEVFTREMVFFLPHLFFFFFLICIYVAFGNILIQLNIVENKEIHKTAKLNFSQITG